LKVGILAHCFGKLPAHDLAECIGTRGFDRIQLALAKALTDSNSELGALSPGYAKHIAETFHKSGVGIASLGCYIDTIHPDADIRRQGIDRFKEHLRFARDFGTAIVATETGQPAPGSNRDHAWTMMREAVKELADEAEKWGVFVGIEPAVGHVIGSIDTMQRLIEEVPSSHIGVVIDPCNLLHPANIDKQEEVMDQAFAQLGSRMVLAHAKDFHFEADGSKRTCALGSGLLNYPHFIRLLKTNKPYIDVTLEGIGGESIDSSLAYIRKAWDQ
jgi:sugar phosphate isomerase/epimerase